MIMMVTEMDDGFDKAAETLNRAHDHDIDSFTVSQGETMGAFKMFGSPH